MAKVACTSIIHVLHMLLFLCFTTAYSSLSDGTLEALPKPGEDFNIKTGKLLAPILRPRVPGSPGSTEVLNHFVDFFKTSLPKWDISLQNSTSKTPVTGDKEIPFVNLIVSRDPPGTSPGEVGRLTLVAHYDSKLAPAGFIGATDSAAPCAMLMHAARTLDSALTKKWESMQAEGVKNDGYLGFEEHRGIQIIFLDGEEAFDTWTNADSLYGARSLAAEMENTPHPALSTYHNPLASISLFLLLDLLGSKDPNVPSYFRTTHWAYCNMASLEDRLRSLALFTSGTESTPNSNTSSQSGKEGGNRQKRTDKVFLPDCDKDEGTKPSRWMGGMMEDDHIPFMARGVEVLHIIPYPFPRVWHEADDDGEHLDLETVSDWAVLVTAFAAEWMELDGFLETKGANEAHQRGLDEDKHQNVVSKTEL